MKKVLIFSLDSYLFQKNDYRPLNATDFFQLRQLGYLLGIFGELACEAELDKKLQLNSQVFFWRCDGQNLEFALSELKAHLDNMARCDEPSEALSVTIISSSRLDYQLALAFGFKFLGVCLHWDEAIAFNCLGLTGEEMIIKSDSPKISDDLFKMIN